jgi:hypothetical protein
MQVTITLPAHTDQEATTSLRELMNSKFTPLSVYRVGGTLVVLAHLPDDSCIPWTLRLAILASAVGAPITGESNRVSALARPNTTAVQMFSTAPSPVAA